MQGARLSNLDKKHGIVFGEKPDDMVSMEDIVVIEDTRTKEKKEE